MGDNVMARNYRRGPKWLPGVVAEVKGPLSYIIQIKGGTLCRRHINQLRNGVADTQLDDIPFSSGTDNKPAINKILVPSFCIYFCIEYRHVECPYLYEIETYCRNYITGRNILYLDTTGKLIVFIQHDKIYLYVYGKNWPHESPPTSKAITKSVRKLIEICDRACKNQPYSREKIAYFLTLSYHNLWFV